MPARVVLDVSKPGPKTPPAAGPCPHPDVQVHTYTDGYRMAWCIHCDDPIPVRETFLVTFD